MKLIVTGGITGRFSRIREMIGKEREITEGCVDLLDTDSGECRHLIRIKVPDAYRDTSYKRDFRLTSASVSNGILYFGAPTQVYMYSWPGLTLKGTIDSPYFNDVHHVAVINEKVYVVSTGMDAVVRFSMDGEFEEIRSVVRDDIRAKFDLSQDYRKIGSLKPHESHPNYVFEMAGDAWCTRFRQRDILNLRTGETIELYKPAGMHDGFYHRGKVYFTAVDGHIIELDANAKAVTDVIDINAIDGRGIPLGWCRGLYVTDEEFFVGFSVLRTTKFEENLHWLKNKVTREGDHQRLPSRIIRIDRKARCITGEFVMQYPCADMIFSLLNGEDISL